MKVYVASSWRNKYQPIVVKMLRNAGFDVYDFKNPELGDTGFHWSQINLEYKLWDVSGFKIGLEHELAEYSFKKDFGHLKDCDACVLVLPCGKSAHLEAGYAIGCGKPTIFYIPEYDEPELMYKMAILVTDNIGVVIHELKNNFKTS